MSLLALVSWPRSRLSWPDIAPPVDGRLVDARSGAPIAGAEIAIVGQRGSVRSDAAGRFQWPVAPPLPVDVIVVLPDGRVARPIRLTSLRRGERTDAGRRRGRHRSRHRDRRRTDDRRRAGRRDHAHSRARISSCVIRGR